MNLTTVVSRERSRACEGPGRQYSACIAKLMRHVRQVTLWTCRILTLLTPGEAYGVRVGDLKALNDGTGRGLLWLHVQGGRKFHEFDGEQVVRTTRTKERAHICEWTIDSRCVVARVWRRELPRHLW